MADKRISDLSSASSITLADLLVLVNESQTKKTTIADLLNLIASQDQFAELDTNGKIPVAQLPDSIFGAVHYQASWNANTNTPALPTAAPENKGWYYVVGTDGTTNVNGVSDWKTGDWLVSNGSVWQKIDNSNALSSWNSRTGDVVPQAGDYTTDLVTETTNKYYTAARVLAELLNGLSIQNNGITASDSILTALGKAQGQINERELISNKGAANGYASLESGKIPISQLPDSIVGAVTYKGTWAANATLNPADSSNKGHYYVVNANGSFNMDGITDWKIGDWIISNGTIWQKIDNTDALSSWNGRTGAVVPQTGDYNTSQVTENAANKYYTAARVLAELLTGFAVNNAPIVATDSVLTAFNKAQGQINNREVITNKGVTNGYASLDSTTKLPKSQLTRGQNSINIDFTGWPAGITEAIKYSFRVPGNVFTAGDILTINAWVSSTGTFGDKTLKVYLNSNSSLTGARLVATFVYTGNALYKFERDICFITTTTVKTLVAPNNPAQNGEYSQGTESTTNIPSVSSDFYVLITLDLDDAGDSSKLERVALQGLYR
jgi:hypothetical protein